VNRYVTFAIEDLGNC